MRYGNFMGCVNFMFPRLPRKPLSFYASGNPDCYRIIQAQGSHNKKDEMIKKYNTKIEKFSVLYHIDFCKIANKDVVFDSLLVCVSVCLLNLNTVCARLKTNSTFNSKDDFDDTFVTPLINEETEGVKNGYDGCYNQLNSESCLICFLVVFNWVPRLIILQNLLAATHLSKIDKRGHILSF